MTNTSQINYYQKYLKYKNKYINLKNTFGGVNNSISINLIDILLPLAIKDEALKYIQFRDTNESEEDYKKRLETYNYDINAHNKCINFEEKFNLLKTVNPTISMDDVIYCYSLNEQDCNRCKAFQYCDIIDDINPKIDIQIITLNKSGNKYSIDNGRHRITAHIIKNNKTVLATINK